MRDDRRARAGVPVPVRARCTRNKVRIRCGESAIVPFGLIVEKAGEVVWERQLEGSEVESSQIVQRALGLFACDGIEPGDVLDLLVRGYDAASDREVVAPLAVSPRAGTPKVELDEPICGVIVCKPEDGRRRRVLGMSADAIREEASGAGNVPAMVLCGDGRGLRLHVGFRHEVLATLKSAELAGVRAAGSKAVLRVVPRIGEAIVEDVVACEVRAAGAVGYPLPYTLARGGESRFGARASCDVELDAAALPPGEWEVRLIVRYLGCAGSIPLRVSGIARPLLKLEGSAAHIGRIGVRLRVSEDGTPVIACEHEQGR